MDGGGEGAAGAVVGNGDVEALGGETGETRKQEVLSGDWAAPGLARLGNGEAGGDLEPLTGVATSASPVTAAAAVSGDSLVANLGPHTLQVSRFL